MSAGEVIAQLLGAPMGYWVAAVWGALWGSFFNVAVHRLGREDASLKMLLRPPSHCPRCGTPIRAYDNVPILGWLWLRGRCRSCREPISIRYPLVELASLLAALAVYHSFVLGHPDAPPLILCRFLVYFYFVGVLLVIGLIDLDTMLIPDAITLPSIVFFFVAGQVIRDVSLIDAVIGGALGFGLLKGLQLGYAAFAGREGLGGGDATLMALVGAFLGWRALPLTLGLGATIGTLVSVPLILWQQRRNRIASQHEAIATQHLPSGDPPSPPIAAQQDGAAVSPEPSPDEPSANQPSLRHIEVPFGPFLVAGALACLFFKDAAWAWLLGYSDQP